MGEPLRTKGKRKIEMTTAEWIGRLVMPVETFPVELREGKGKILTLREEKEISSAVEWLLEILKDDWHNNGGKHNFSKVNSRIMEAFQDLNSQSNEKEKEAD